MPSDSPESGQKPFVVFDGNCQSHHLAAVFDAAGIAETWVNGHDFGTVPSFRGRLARYATEDACLQMMAHARSQGRICIQATQSTPWSEATAMSYTGLAHEVVRFPYLHCNIYLRASGGGGARASLKRIYESDLSVIRLCQDYAKSGFDFAGFVEAEQIRRPLFHMHVHPGADLVGALVRDLGQRTETFPDDAVESAAKELEASEGINVFTQHPISDQAREMLGFTWPRDYPQYSAMIATVGAGNWPSFLAQAPTWEPLFAHETQYWAGLFYTALGLGRDDLLDQAFERLVLMSPGFPQFWKMAYSHAHVEMRAQLYERACSIYEAQRQLNNLLCFMQSTDGHHDAAIAHGRRFLEQGQDLNDGFVPLMLALEAAGHTEEARSTAYAFAVAQPAERRGEIEAVLRAYPLVQDLVLPAE